MLIRRVVLSTLLAVTATSSLANTKWADTLSEYFSVKEKSRRLILANLDSNNQRCQWGARTGEKRVRDLR